MKKRFIVLSSLITILLASFPVVVCADETAQDSSNLHSLSDGVFLDSYFYDNYDLLPYIESDGSQYIDSSVPASSDLLINFKFSIVNNIYTGWQTVFGSLDSNQIGTYFQYQNHNGNSYFGYHNSSYSYVIQNLVPNNVLDITFDKNKFYLNNNFLHQNTYSEYNNNVNMILFGLKRINTVANNSLSSIKLYKFSIYDYSADNGNGAYIRYYYPAKAKTSETIGLYDAVSKTFVTTATSSSFVNPTDDKVLNFQISDFVTSGLGWIDDIFDFVIATPIILFFFAVALAGSIYRWARRVVHF